MLNPSERFARISIILLTRHRARADEENGRPSPLTKTSALSVETSARINAVRSLNSSLAQALRITIRISERKPAPHQYAEQDHAAKHQRQPLQQNGAMASPRCENARSIETAPIGNKSPPVPSENRPGPCRRCCPCCNRARSESPRRRPLHQAGIKIFWMLDQRSHVRPISAFFPLACAFGVA